MQVEALISWEIQPAFCTGLHRGWIDLLGAAAEGCPKKPSLRDSADRRDRSEPREKSLDRSVGVT